MDTFGQETVENIFTLLGAKLNNNRVIPSFRGAYAYIGASEPMINAKANDGSKSKVVIRNGFTYVDMGVGVRVRPNFGAKKVLFYITLDEGADLFDLLIVKTRGTNTKVLKHLEGLFFDDLASVVESTYDDLIKSECDGFIHI